MFENNRLTQLLGIKYPVLQGGMVWCTDVRLVSAVSDCGGLGVVGAGSYTVSSLQRALCELERLRLVYGVNLPMQYSEADRLMEVILKSEVPVVITSAGNPGKYARALQEAGKKVGHVISNRQQAQKAVQSGVDFIVAEGVEAGGHNGLDGLTTLVLVQQIRAEFSVPLVAAGGFFDGYGLAAALALGADGVQMGSRFACSQESAASLAYKQSLLGVRESGTLLTGQAWGPTRMMRNPYSEKLMEMERAGASAEEQKAYIGSGRTRLGIAEGDVNEGELEVGQVAALFKRIESVEEIFSNILHTYRAAVERLFNQD